MERAAEGEGKAKNKPWSASQSRSHKGEEALHVYVYVCACVCVCVCVLREKQCMWEAYIVKNEVFSLRSGILLGRDGERKQGKREMKRACNMASHRLSSKT